MSTNETFPQWLERRRKEKGLAKGWLAKQMNVSRVTFWTLAKNDSFSDSEQSKLRELLK